MDPSINQVINFKLPASEAWIPGLLFTNAISEINPIPKWAQDLKITLSSDGTLAFPILAPMEFHCELKLEKFPFDEQICSLVIESWENSQMVKLNDGGIAISSEKFISTASVWRLVNTSSKFQQKKYANDPFLSYHQVVYTFHIERKYQNDIIGIFLPCYVLQILLLWSVLIPPESPDRSLFCMTVVLSYTVLQNLIDANIPSTSETIYVIVFLAYQLIGSLVVTCFCLLMCDLACRQYFKRNIKSKFQLVKEIQLSRLLDIFFFSLAFLFLLIVDVYIILKIAI